MIEVRTYQEDAQTASDFTHRVWSDRYELEAPVVDWNADYFDWQLGLDRPGARDFLVAAYEGSKLVGTLFAERMEFQLRGEPLVGTMGSWLTVDADHRGQGIAKKLADEQRRRHREQNAKFMLGFGFLGSDGPKFWESLSDTQVLGRVGFWVRVFDHHRLAAWSPALRDRLAAHLLGPFFAGVPKTVPSPDVHPYEPKHLADCIELVKGLERTAQLGYRWSSERLHHQLTSGKLQHTLVFEREGRARGLINYYLLGMTGRTRMPVAVIDLLAVEPLNAGERRALIDTALLKMAGDGAGFAMALRLPCYKKVGLFGAGFVPMPGDTCFLCTLIAPDFSLGGVEALHVHWR